MIIEPESLIIHKPSLQTAEGRIISLLLAVGFWGALAYLFRVLLAVTGWGAAWGIYSTVAANMDIDAVLREAMLVYVPSVLVLVTLLWGWALYNWLRFHGERDKRCVPPPSLCLEDVSKECSLPLSLLQEMREAKVGVCYFDDEGNIQTVNCCSSMSEADKLLRAA